jgi:hypothetical protein
MIRTINKKMLDKESQQIYEYIYGFLEDWELGDNLACDPVRLETMMDLVANDLKGVINELKKEALKNEITTSEHVELAKIELVTQIAIKEWFEEKANMCLEAIK